MKNAVSQEILRGRKEISEYIRVSIPMLNRLINIGLIPVCRLSQSDKGMMVISKRKILEAIDAESERQRKRVGGNA